MESLPVENQRVKKIIDFTTNGNVLQFSKEIGISQPRINRLFSIDSRNGKYPLISFEIAQAIINKFVNIRAEWLLTGEEPMLKSETQEQTVSHNDKYTALLEENNATLKSQLKDKEEKETLLKDKIADLECRLELVELKNKEAMSAKIEIQRARLQAKKALLSEKDEIIFTQNNTINEQNEEINAMKSRHLPPDDPLQPSKGV